MSKSDAVKQTTVSALLRKGCLALVAAALCCLAEPASAEYQLDNWTNTNGLPHNTVVSILQTRDGYLWLATKDGLARFDGVRFTVFNKGNTPGISSNRLMILFEDSHGDLLIGTDDGGLIRYREGVFTSYSISGVQPEGPILAIQEDEDSERSLWLLTRTGITQWKDGRIISEIPAAALPEPARYQAQGGNTQRLKTGNIWYVDSRGLHRFERGRWATYTASEGLSSLKVFSVCEDHGGSLWVATTDKGVFRFKGGKTTLYPSRDPLPTYQATFVCEDPRQGLWLAGIDSLFHLNDGRLTRLAYPSCSGPGKIQDIYRDREGTVWVATEFCGLFRLRREFITVYTTEQGLIANNVYPVCEDRDGAIWIGAWSGGLSRFKDGVFTNFKADTGSTPHNPGISGLVTALHTDRAGRVLIGSFAGAHTFEDGLISAFPARFETGEVPSAMLHDREGTYWFGTQQGLIKYRNGAVSRLGTSEGLASNDVKVIIEGGGGAVWIGTYGGVTRSQDNALTSYTERDGLASNRVRSLYEDGDGTLWIGTYDGGLSRLKDGRLTTCTQKDGLFDHGVFQILEDGRGHFWIGCNRGIYRVNKQELNDFADGKRASITSVSYDRGDGLRNIECNGGRWPTGVRARDGRLWIATQQGVAVVDPESLVLNQQPPPVMIEGCTLDRNHLPSASDVRVNPGQENLEIQYTGLSFIKAEQVRFRYRLEGLDEEWTDAGTRRTAYYPYLPPGNYTFRVTAANSDGVWNTDGASIQVTVIPPFYGTWWFVAVATLIATGIVFATFEFRLSRMRKRRLVHEAFSRRLIASQENERKRIAAELHDSLGQSLLIIKNRSLLGINRHTDSGAALKEFNEIESTVTHALEEVRTIAHNLRPYQLDRLGLTMAIEAIISKVSSSSPIEFTSDIDEIDGLLSAESEINLYRIVQEAISNIVRHSEASHAFLAVKRVDNRISLSIRDDGKGFVTEAEGETKSDRRGLGLTGIVERGRILGGRCAINSAPGRGTEISLHLDLSSEYKGSINDRRNGE